MSKEPDSGGIIVVVFFFRQSGKKKLPQKVLTHSFFEVFVLKVSFPGKKKIRDLCPGLLARSVLTRVMGLEVPTMKQCITMVNDLTLRPINKKQIYKVKNEVEQMLLGRAD